jgi:hypothetical protein
MVNLRQMSMPEVPTTMRERKMRENKRMKG